MSMSHFDAVLLVLQTEKEMDAKEVKVACLKNHEVQIPIGTVYFILNTLVAREWAFSRKDKGISLFLLTDRGREEQGCLGLDAGDFLA